MAATTYHGAGLAIPADTAGSKTKGATSKSGTKGFWARFYNALADSQMRRAERELAHYGYVLPRDFARTQARREDEPFGGW